MYRLPPYPLRWLVILQVVLPWSEFHLLSLVCLARSVFLPPCIAGLFCSYDSSQLSKLYFRGRNSIYWALCLTRSVLLPPSIAASFHMKTRNSPSCRSVVGIPSNEPWVSLDRFPYHPVSPASFPMMTRNSPSCTYVVGIPSTEPCVSLDRFSYHHKSPASLPPTMTRNFPSFTSVVGILSTEPPVSLDGLSYYSVLYIANLVPSYVDLQLSRL